MNHCVEKLAIAVMLLMSATTSYAWEMLGRVVIIGPLQVRAITRMEDPNHDANIALTDAILFEAGVKVDEDDDICVYKTLCKSTAKDYSVCSNTDYCGRGSATEGLTVLLGVPIPWTRRSWGGGGAGEVPVCKISGGGGGGGNQNRPR